MDTIKRIQTITAEREPVYTKPNIHTFIKHIHQEYRRALIVRDMFPDVQKQEEFFHGICQTYHTTIKDIHDKVEVFIFINTYVYFKSVFKSPFFCSFPLYQPHSERR